VRRSPWIFVLALGAGCSLDTVTLEQPRAGQDAGPAAAVVDAGVALDAEVRSASDAAVGPDVVEPAAPTQAYLVTASEFRTTILSLRDPAHPSPIADGDGAEDDEPLPLYDVTGDERGRVYAGRFGGVEISQLQDDRVVFRAHLPLDGADARSVAAGHGLLCVAIGSGVVIVDVRDLRALRVVGHIPAETFIADVALLDGMRLAVYEGSDPALRLYDLSQPDQPTLVDVYITDFVTSRSSGLAAAAGFVAVNVTYGASDSALWFWRAPLGQPVTSFGFHPQISAPHGGGVGLWRAGQSAFGYFSDQQAGVAIAEARADDLPPRAGRLGGEAHDLTVWGDHLYVADGAGVVTYALSPEAPHQPVRVDRLELGGAAERLTVVEISGDADE
jgi:hypothetical protein